MSKTLRFFKISSLLVLSQIIASEGFAQVGPLMSQSGYYYICFEEFECDCGVSCFCNTEAKYGKQYGPPYYVCWVDMSSKKEVNCKGQNKLYFKENGVISPLCPETK